MWRERFASTMADMKNIHDLALDGKENPVYVRFVAVEELAHFKGKLHGLRSERAAFWKGSKGRNSVIQSQEPPDAGLSGVL
jgi:hypothetical protein